MEERTWENPGAIQPVRTWSQVTRQAVGIAGVVMTTAAACYSVYRSTLFWVIFKLTALSINSLGAPYLGLPPTITDEQLNALSLPMGDLSNTDHPYNHGSYYTYADNFNFVYEHNTIFDFMLSNLLLMCLFYGMIDPYSRAFRVFLFLCNTTAYTTISLFLDKSYLTTFLLCYLRYNKLNLRNSFAETGFKFNLLDLCSIANEINTERFK